MLHALGLRGVQKVQRPSDVDVPQVGQRAMVTPAVAIPIQGEMVHDVDATGGLIHDALVRHSPVQIVRRETNEFQSGFTNAVKATSAQVEDSRGIAFAQEELTEAGPDENRSPCDQSLCHFGSLLP